MLEPQTSFYNGAGHFSQDSYFCQHAMCQKIKYES